VKSQTFGLEPAEIAGLLEQREAVLHGIREGIVAVDLDGRITLLNDEARRLLALESEAVGSSVATVLAPGRVRDVLLGARDGPDQLVVTQGRVLVANRMPVYVRGEVTGAVISFRDRTELAEVTRELEGVRTVTDALRAQAHEFSNRLHTIVGLVELGREREAISLSTEDAVAHQELIETLLGRVGDPTLSALLLAKAVVAAERGISLRISDEMLVVREFDEVRDVVTIVGNLIDNALDAVAEGPTTTGRWVAVTVRVATEGIHIQVHDSGPGVDPGMADRIFEEGFTTKEAGSQPMRGLGLALVQQVVRRHGGEITVRDDGGAVFRSDPLRRRGTATARRNTHPARAGEADDRTLIVDDDFRVADLHRLYTGIGFSRQDREDRHGHRWGGLPDLVLLDIYLPDMSGIDVLRRLREQRRPVDVITLTAAKDVATLRAAMHGGSVHYLIKPFTFAVFRERLESYAAVASRLGQVAEASQADVDRMYGLLRPGDERELPKGLSAATRDLVIDTLRTAGEPLSAVQVASVAGVARVTARRYLDHLAETGVVELTLNYGSPGRPEHRYGLAGRP
jgi:response regulator of citrate/malate metabolism/signal transduction histidine kinase